MEMKEYIDALKNKKEGNGERRWCIFSMARSCAENEEVLCEVDALSGGHKGHLAYPS